MIFAVALIVFGPRRLPEIGKTLGKALNEFKKASDDLKHTIEREVQVEETRQALSPLISPATYTVSRAEPVKAPAGDQAVPTSSSTTSEPSSTSAHDAPATPAPTHFE